MNPDTKIDLEQAIMVVWATCDDLKLFADAYYGGEREMTIDEAFGHIDGIRGLLELRLEKLYDTYKQKFELDQYCTDPETLEKREYFYASLGLKPKKKGSKK
jgi:hypothetical protein